MKLVLLHEVSQLGAPGDIVEVKDGYGRNYLLPQGLATIATKGAQKQAETIKRAQQVKTIRDLDHANEIKAQLNALSVRIETRVGDSGRLFGSITAADVVAAVKSSGGPNLDRRRVELPGHIKTVGSYKVAIKLHPQVTVNVPVSVVAAS